MVREALFPAGQADVSSASEMGDTAIQDAINDAQTEVDARLAPKYAVPFKNPYPPLIVSITRDKAQYLATLTHRDSDIPPTDPVQLRYNRAELLLAAIQAGTISLDIATASGPPEAEEIPDMVVNPVGGGDVFTPDDAGLAVGNDGMLHVASNYPKTRGV